MITDELIQEIKSGFRLEWTGIHGISHWARVYDNGIRLAQLTGANLAVVQLFAVFHDSRRRNDYIDPRHGARGAELALRLRTSHFPQLTDSEFALLHTACSLHTDEPTHEDITVRTCFDADKLDLARVGVPTEHIYFCTGEAVTNSLISWAARRGRDRLIPNNVLGNHAGEE